LKKKILALLPESIGGRLTMTSLFKGFEQLDFELTIIDPLKDAETLINGLNMNEYDFLLSYDFLGIKFKTDFALNIKTVNYFSDVIESECSGVYWQEYYDKLQEKDCSKTNFVFYWDKALTDEAEGIANITYLPHVVDVDTYKNMHLVPEYDVMFAGRLTYGVRLERFLNIVKSLPDVKFALYCFPKYFKSICEMVPESDREILQSIYKSFIDSEAQMSEAINKSKIVINFTSQGKSSLNYRLFQVLACEKLLLTDYRSELEDLFTIGHDVICYKDDSELVELIKDYLKRPDEYEKIIKNGRKTIESKYFPVIAATKILQTLQI